MDRSMLFAGRRRLVGLRPALAVAGGVAVTALLGALAAAGAPTAAAQGAAQRWEV